MRIWFDLSNSPHINLFHDLIRDLESHGHQIIVTCRPLANTIDLLEQKQIKYNIVGEHYGKNIFKKIFGYPIRVIQLARFLRKLKPDLAVSQSSFHSPLVAKLLGIPSIYTNDNEHAMGNIPSFIFATKILIPENLSIEKIVRLGASKRKVSQYPGVKEGIYLWRLGETINQKRKENKNPEIQIFVRPEPLTAQYYSAGTNFLDDALMALQNRYSITVLPRDKTQLTHYKQNKFAEIKVPEKPLRFVEIAEDCSLFIGAGGSMTRELAVLGIPTLSVYQDNLLEVDQYLIKKHLMSFEPQITAAIIVTYLDDLKETAPSTELLAKGRAAYDFFKAEILKFDSK
jgi:predicted glycosyltransferase